MSSKTTNLQMTLPAGSDIVDVQVLNDNFSIIDRAVGAKPAAPLSAMIERNTEAIALINNEIIRLRPNVQSYSATIKTKDTTGITLVSEGQTVTGQYKNNYYVEANFTNPDPVIYNRLFITVYGTSDNGYRANSFSTIIDNADVFTDTNYTMITTLTAPTAAIVAKGSYPPANAPGALVRKKTNNSINFRLYNTVPIELNPDGTTVKDPVKVMFKVIWFHA